MQSKVIHQNFISLSNVMYVLYTEINCRPIINTLHLFILSFVHSEIISAKFSGFTGSRGKNVALIFLSVLTSKLSLRFKNPWHHSSRMIILACLQNLLNDKREKYICRVSISISCLDFTYSFHNFMTIPLRVIFRVMTHYDMYLLSSRRYRHFTFTPY